MGNKQGKQSHRSVKEIQKLRKQNQEEKENSQEPIPIRTAPGHEPYNVPAGTDPLQAAAMQMVRNFQVLGLFCFGHCGLHFNPKPLI